MQAGGAVFRVTCDMSCLGACPRARTVARLFICGVHFLFRTSLRVASRRPSCSVCTRRCADAQAAARRELEMDRYPAADDVAEDEAEEEEEPVDEETRKQLNKARAAVGMEPLAS